MPSTSTRTSTSGASRRSSTRPCDESVVGGELKGLTKLLAEGRSDAEQRLIDDARGKGANAIVAFRFDTSEMGTSGTEICAYGTAVRVRPVA
jgi:uncharacterized protein YbjQ (UPF0145 family)